MYIIVANVARKDNEALIQTTVVVSRSSILSNALFGQPPPSKSGLVFRWMRAHWPIASGPEYGPSIHCFYSKWIVIFPFKSGFDDPPPNFGRICFRSFCLSCASILIPEPKRRECRSKIARRSSSRFLTPRAASTTSAQGRFMAWTTTSYVLYSQLSMWR